jgi:phage gp46-like protein
MTDTRLKQYYSLEGVTMDLLLTQLGELDEREEMATAVRVALGTDRQSAADEVLPDLDSTDRRGWWGDLQAEEIWSGWPIGCKNWLLTRAKITQAPSREGSTLERAKRYTEEALKPFIDKRIASNITVSAARTELQRIEVTATIYRGPISEIDLRYQLLWQEDFLSADDAAEDVPLSIDMKIRVPYGNLRLSSVGPNIPLRPDQTNLLLSTTAPTVIATTGRNPPAGNLVLSPTAPTRVVA